MAPDAGDPILVLGPLLRYIGETEATFWVETDRPCRVEVLGHAARTFMVAGHHYGLVVVTGLRPGTEYPYQVALDGTVRWPEPDSAFGPSVLRTLDASGPQRLVFGSCRVAELPPPRRDHAHRDHAHRDHAHRRRARRGRERGPDAMAALGHTLAGRPRESWPHSMLLIGDQVYADHVGPATRRFIASRRDPRDPPGHEVADFEEYCALYREAWSEPAVRWLLSVIPTIMVFDDHDVHDDWNTSATWRRQFQARPWWQSRISGAYLSYWIYQHLGNLSPAELGTSDLWRQVQEAEDADPVLRDLAARAEARAAGIRWSVRRDFGRVRVVVIDSRSRRVVDDDRHRLMVDEAEWEWVRQSGAGDFEHLVLATSVPLLLPLGIHYLEAWNEALCAGAWGSLLRPAAERLRQVVDLEHWAAFGASFSAFETLLGDLATGSASTGSAGTGPAGTGSAGTGSGGTAPASITVISGDIHHNYLAAVELPGTRSSNTVPINTVPNNTVPNNTVPNNSRPDGTVVYQAVSSPMHNVMPDRLRLAHRLVTSRLGTLATTAAARLAGVRGPRARWRITDGPWFANMIAELSYDGRRARIRFDRTVPEASGPSDAAGPAGLEPACEAVLT